jgi:hypothetical protein
VLEKPEKEHEFLKLSEETKDPKPHLLSPLEKTQGKQENSPGPTEILKTLQKARQALFHLSHSTSWVGYFSR